MKLYISNFEIKFHLTSLTLFFYFRYLFLLSNSWALHNSKTYWLYLFLLIVVYYMRQKIINS